MAEPTATPALTPAAQDYLKVIWTASEWSAQPISSKVLADRLGLAASTVSESVRKLAEQGLIDHVRYGAITLTDAGTAAAVAIVRRHRLIETFLVRELDYGWDEVHDEAEVLEHAVSDLMIGRIDAKLGFPSRDPHGDPIPCPDGTLPLISGQRLVELAAGMGGTITRISDEQPDLLRYFDALGIAPDIELTVLARRDFAGTISVRISGHSPDAPPIELGKSAAEAIWLIDVTEAQPTPNLRNPSA